MWTKEKLESYKKISGKTWRKLAHDIGTKERYLRAIRRGEKIGAPTLERAEQIERASTVKQASIALQQQAGITRKELAKRMGVGARHLRKVHRGEKISRPTVERILTEVRRQGIETPQTKFFFRDLATDRISRIIADAMPTWRGRKKWEIDRITAEWMVDLDKDMQNETWKLARDLYEEQMVTG